MLTLILRKVIYQAENGTAIKSQSWDSNAGLLNTEIMFLIVMIHWSSNTVFEAFHIHSRTQGMISTRPKVKAAWGDRIPSSVAQRLSNQPCQGCRQHQHHKLPGRGCHSTSITPQTPMGQQVTWPQSPARTHLNFIVLPRVSLWVALRRAGRNQLMSPPVISRVLRAYAWSDLPGEAIGTDVFHL